MACVLGEARRAGAVLCAIAAGLAAIGGCGDRPAPWNEPGVTGGDDGSDDGPSAEVSSSTGVPPLEFCAGPTTLRYHPGTGEIDAFPDDVLTEDAATATGLRVRNLAGELVDDDAIAPFPSVVAGLATLDGFGTTGTAFFRITGELDPATLPAPGSETDPSSSSLLLVELDAAEPTFVELDWRLETDPSGETTLLAAPLLALRPATRYGLALTTAARDLEGGCIAPSPAMIELLSGTAQTPELARVQDRYDALLAVLIEAGAIASPTDLSAAIVFTTQTTTDESVAIADAIRIANAPPMTTFGCEPYGLVYRQCEVIMTVADFTSGGVVTDAPEPQGFYDLPATAFLPSGGTPPFPTIVFGHGLGGDRTNAWSLASRVCPEGYAVVAVDAPKHGDHPDIPLIDPAIDLLGVTGDGDDPFLPLEARDNFRQATYDKLQLLRRIEAGMDVGGGMTPDLDISRLHYVGMSLGAVMAPQFLALAPEMRSATLVVGGARLTDIVANSPDFSPLVLIVTEGLDAPARARMLAISQAALDRGDPEVFSRHVLGERIAGFDGGHPQLLAQLALGDTIVPNSSTGYLVRGLGIPIAGDAPVALRGVMVLPDLPIVGNMAPGLTAALYQFGEVLDERTPGGMVPATHYNVQSDALAEEQRRVFLSTAEDRGGSTLIDPFAP